MKTQKNSITVGYIIKSNKINFEDIMVGDNLQFVSRKKLGTINAKITDVDNKNEKITFENTDFEDCICYHTKYSIDLGWNVFLIKRTLK